MKDINFIDRESEMEYLEGINARKGKQLVVLYGRRRVGKTELATHFARDKKSIYFLADKRGTQSNAERFASTCAAHFNDVAPAVKNFDDVFLYVKNRIKGERIIVIVDEFSYLVEKDESVPSVFQLVYDEVLKGTNVFLILAGSSMSMMYKGALSYESPLYGRTGEWMLRSMPFREIRKFYPGLSFEETVFAYAIVGGIPAYAAQFDGRSIFEGIRSNILKKGEFLYREPELLLREELREPSTYLSILEAMSKNAKLTNIANAARIPAKDMPKYLKVLEDLELTYRIVPVTEKKSKKALYFMKDNFFNFWFTFVYPRKSELEEGKANEVLKIIKRDFNSYVGKAFERVCSEYLEDKRPVNFTRIGKWWGYSKEEGKKGRTLEEIDIVALDEDTKTILFAECKWKDGIDAEEVLRNLRKKAELVEWNRGDRKEKFAIFAKSFKKRADGASLFDLTDLGR